MEATTTLVVLLVAAAGTALWLWALADTLRRPADSFAVGGRALWAVVIALNPRRQCDCCRAKDRGDAHQREYR